MEKKSTTDVKATSPAETILLMLNTALNCVLMSVSLLSQFLSLCLSFPCFSQQWHRKHKVRVYAAMMSLSGVCVCLCVYVGRVEFVEKQMNSRTGHFS